MKTRKEKQEGLEALAEQFKNANAAMLVSYETPLLSAVSQLIAAVDG